MTGHPQPSGEAEMRREEAEAQRFLLYQEQCNDLRAQLHAATAWLAERTGLSNRDLNEQLAARVAANRKAEACESSGYPSPS